jgi:acetolactate synthase-1/2/3 large subunit
MAQVPGSYLIARTLKEEQVRHMFFLIGGPIYEIVNSAQDMGIKAIDFRHEQAAAMAAHAYARVTGLPGVTTAASGPGTLNLLTGHYNAFIDNAPMVTLGGAGRLSDFGRGGFQEIDQAAIFAPISKATMRPTDAARYPEMIAAAFRDATTGRPGPVFVDCMEDVLYATVDEAAAPPPTRPARLARPEADPAMVRETVALLKNADKPLIVSGSGVLWSKAWDALREFVDRAGVPFYTTPLSRGVIPEDHELSFPAARSTAMREADVVLIVGTRLNWILDFGKRFSETARLIQIDIHAAEIGHNRAIEVGLVGDARAVLGQLNAEAARTGMKSKADSAWVAYLREQNTSREERSKALLNSRQVPIHPLRLCNEIRSFLDRDAILTVDGNEILHFARQSIPTYEPGHRLNSGATGCMGVGLPFAVGAKVARPDKQVLSLHGDGSLGMNIMELDTAVRHKLPIVVVVSNNEGWFARQEGVRKPGRELGVVRYDKVAESLGGHGEFVEKPEDIRPALERAFKSGLPAIVNVHTDPTARGMSTFSGAKMYAQAMNV